jgi:hypothetical protein
MLNEETVGEQKRRAAVIVGRYSPPTIGHYAIINKVKKFIRENPELKLSVVPIIVVVEGKETSKDKQRNPLTAKERVAFMTGSGKAQGCRFLIAGSAFEAFEEVRKAEYEPIAVAAGSDRGGKYLEMLDKYFKTNDHEPIDHYEIELKRDSEASEAKGQDKQQALSDILQHMDDEIPTDMVSASLARHAVQKDELAKFSVIVGLKEKPKLASMMFDKIKAALAEPKEEE